MPSLKKSVSISLIGLYAAGAWAATEKHLILYKTSLSREFQALTLEGKQKHMMTTTARQESRVFGAAGLSQAVPGARRLWIAGATIAELSAKQAKQIAAHPDVTRVIPMRGRARLIEPVETPLVAGELTSGYTYGLEKIRVPELRQKYPGLDGTGVRVGIIDTGIMESHHELSGKVVAFRDFIARRTQPYDDHGHGTHVAGVVAGGSPRSRNLIGVAPAAGLVIAKAFSQYGGSELEGLYMSLQWMADPDENPQTADAPAVISGSWNVEIETAKVTPEDEPFCRIVDNLKALGIVSVFSAGNDGPKDATVLVPGACPNTVAVGASDEDDNIASFSSRGPIQWKTTTTLKPDITASGKHIYSSWRDGDYAYKSGTSMSTPFVSGAMALLAQSARRKSPDVLIQGMLGTAKDMGPAGFDNAWGYGMLDVLSAVETVSK